MKGRENICERYGILPPRMEYCGLSYPKEAIMVSPIRKEIIIYHNFISIVHLTQQPFTYLSILEREALLLPCE